MSYHGVVVRGKFAAFVILLVSLMMQTRAGLAAAVNLAWDAAPDPSVVGYRVYYGGASGVYSNAVAVGMTTTVTLSNLVAGQTYYFAAVAYDADNVESLFSNEISYVPAGPTNRPPTLGAIASLTLAEDAGGQTVNLSGISSGDASEVQALAVTATSSNPALIPNPTVSYTSPNAVGTLSFTPAAQGFGSATITVQVNDGGASNNIMTRTFTVTVNAVNDVPTLNALTGVTLNENDGLQTVSLSGISSGAANESQSLSLTATSSNPGLIPSPTVSYTSPNATGSLSFTPVAYGSGSATITVQVSDGSASNNIVTRTFSVTVNAVNQAPTLGALAALTVNEGGGQQTVNLTGISSGATNESQTLTITATSSNPALIPNPTVTYMSPSATGLLRFAPVTGSGGTATITVTVNDGGSANSSVTRTFAVTVNRLPTITSIANQTNSIGQTFAPIAFTIGDTETAANQLVVTASSTNATLVSSAGLNLSGTGSSRSLSITPEADATGLTELTVTVNDGQASAQTTFLVRVKPLPVAPQNLRVVAAAP
jgi:hypothetical protein